LDILRLELSEAIAVVVALLVELSAVNVVDVVVATGF